MSVGETEFHGRVVETTTATTFTIDSFRARLWYVDMTAGSQQVRMPDATTLKPGANIAVVVMQTGSSTVTIADNGGTGINLSDGSTTLAADEGVRMHLVDNADADGTWAGKVYSASFAPNPTPVEMAHVVGGAIAADQRVQQYDHQLDVTTLMTGVKPSDITNGGGFQINDTTGVFFGDIATPFDQVDEFTPSTDAWAALTDSPRDFSQGQCGALGSTAAGYTAGRATDPDETQSYDRTGDSWTLETNKPLGCFQGNGVMDDNVDLFVANGNEVTVDEQVHFERYTPSTDAWATRRNQPSPAVSDVSIGHVDDGGGMILRMGGFSTVREDDVDVYDVVADAWVAKGDFPSPTSGSAREEVGLCGPENIMHLLGGQGPASQANDHVYRYSFALDTWTQKADLSIATSNASQTTVAIQP